MTLAALALVVFGAYDSYPRMPPYCWCFDFQVGRDEDEEEREELGQSGDDAETALADEVTPLRSEPPGGAPMGAPSSGVPLNGAPIPAASADAPPCPSVSLSLSRSCSRNTDEDDEPTSSSSSSSDDDSSLGKLSRAPEEFLMQPTRHDCLL